MHSSTYFFDLVGSRSEPPWLNPTVSCKYVSNGDVPKTRFEIDRRSRSGNLMHLAMSDFDSTGCAFTAQNELLDMPPL